MSQSSLTGHADPRWGSENRPRKAEAIRQTLLHFAGPEIADGDWVDIGCGSGLIAATLAPRVRSMLGVDPEPWTRWADLIHRHGNLHFTRASSSELAAILDTSSADVVICNQVYEHVDDPQHLISEIHRILKPTGVCYFAGPNLLFPIEPHVFWPFVHWLPRRWALRMMRAFRARHLIDANSVAYWTLRRWLRRFTVTNGIPWMIRHPHELGRHGLPWRILSTLPTIAIEIFTPFSPTFVFILRKTPR